jgi:hypothetical protein
MRIAMTRFRQSPDESVALVLAVMGVLALLSFVMAGIVGEREKSVRTAQGAAALVHATTHTHRAG